MASKSVAAGKAESANPIATTGRPSLIMQMAARYDIDAEKMLATLKATAFRGEPGKEVTNEQLMALLVVAKEYNLNPWLKEIYAFPDKGGGIVPVIGVDGWVRMMNQHEHFDSQEFRYPEGYDDPEVIPPWIDCVIYRKDRSRPTVVREFFDEVKRNTGPWQSHPRRMLRHKALIQCVRLAFGYGGAYDPDEAERIREVDITPPRKTPATEAPKALTSAPALATAEQLALIREKLSGAEIVECDACGQFQLEKLEALKFDHVPEMLAWIATKAR